MDMTPSRIELRIGELVLDGLEGVDGQAVGAAVQRELARLLGSGGVPPAWRRSGLQVTRLDAGAFTVTPGSPSEDVGAHVARAVHGSLVGRMP